LFCKQNKTRNKTVKAILIYSTKITELNSVGKKTPISSLHLSEKCSFTKSKLRFF